MTIVHDSIFNNGGTPAKAPAKKKPAEKALSKMNKAELQKLAKKLKVSGKGTNKEIAARIKNAQKK
ncbi:MAG: hypothetical protein ACPGQQ_00870 [Candidatus Puniceispirillaceae bacterium]